MKTNTFKIVPLVLAVEIFISCQFASAQMIQCKSLFEPRKIDINEHLDPNSYIKKTGATSIFDIAKHNFQSTHIESVKNKPSLLQGVDLSSFIWHKSQNSMSEITHSGFGKTLLGSTQIEVLVKNNNFISIEIKISKPIQDSHFQEKLNLLKKIFLDLEISQTQNEDVRLVLKQNHFSNPENFLKSSKSLVSTLSIDPYGVLGFNERKPILKFNLPRAFTNSVELKPYFEFLSQFTEWKAYDWGISGYTPRVAGQDRVGITIEPKYKNLQVWLMNNSPVSTEISSIRRVAWALIEYGYNNNNNVQLSPKAHITGINGISVTNLKLSIRDLDFAILLAKTQNDPYFDQPLKNLNTDQQQFLSNWMKYNFTPGDSYSQRRVSVSDIFE